MSIFKSLSAAVFGLLGSCSQAIDEIVVSLQPRPQEPKDRPYVIREVRLPGGTDGVTLAGELTMPPGEGPFPAVVLITGSGPHDRNEVVSGHKVFLVLSDHLTRRGYAVLRYDDRGIGDSTGDFATATTHDFATDAAAALSWLRTQPGIDGGWAGYAGHSEGGYVAALAAPMERPDFMVLLAGPSQILSDVILLQQGEISRASDMTEEALATNQRHAVGLLDILRSSSGPREAQDRIETFFRDEGVPDSRIRENLDLWATPWGLWIVDFDPRPALSAYDGPVLALFGETDLQVSAEANAPDMQAALGHPDSEVLTLAGLNHLFQPSESGLPQEYWKIATTFDTGAMNTIADWLDRILPAD